MKNVRKIYDWPAIRAFYDRGHTPAECQREFGITNGAWHGAVQRGAIVPRTHTPHSSTRRAAVAELAASGCSQAEIARGLDISRSTVSFHMRQLGVPPKSAAANRYDWDEVRAFYSAGHSAAECRARFNFGRDCWAAAVRRGEISPRPRLEPLEDILGAGRRRSRQHVRLRLLLAGLKVERCEACGVKDWRGKPLSLELHHVNGDGNDNRLENLRLLCPNCHSQTDTWGARNKGRRRERAPPSGAASVGSLPLDQRG